MSENDFVGGSSENADTGHEGTLNDEPGTNGVEGNHVETIAEFEISRSVKFGHECISCISQLQMDATFMKELN